jgi:antirestriction protein
MNQASERRKDMKGGGKEQHPSAVNALESKEAGPDPPRIYVASLADYNNGRLHGQWLDAAQEPEALRAGVTEMLRTSPLPRAEEWAIHDHEGFAGLAIHEYEDLARVSALAMGLRRHGAAFAAWASLKGSEAAEVEDFDRQFVGHFASPAAFAERFLEDFGADSALHKHLPQWLRPYVRLDLETFGRDLDASGDFLFAEGDGGVYVFDGWGS